MYGTQFSSPTTFSPRNYQATNPQFTQQDMTDSIASAQSGQHKEILGNTRKYFKINLDIK